MRVCDSGTGKGGGMMQNGEGCQNCRSLKLNQFNSLTQTQKKKEKKAVSCLCIYHCCFLRVFFYSPLGWVSLWFEVEEEEAEDPCPGIVDEGAAPSSSGDDDSVSSAGPWNRTF